jgi:hypothetical protein
MGNALTAQELLRDISARTGLSESLTHSIFADVPIDFPVVISAKLPFGVHRIGMTGITLFGRVWLHNSVQDFPPEDLLLLLRHEATHIRQQRAHPFGFYLRYALGWIAGVVAARNISLGTPSRRLSRWMRAYYAIPFEREAYREEADAKATVDEALRLR